MSAALPAPFMGWKSRALNHLVDCIRTREIVASADILPTDTGKGIALSLVSPVGAMVGFPFGSIHHWGLAIVGGSATIYPGDFQTGPSNYLATPKTTFAITEDAQYVGITYDPNAQTLSLISPTTDKPVSSGGTYSNWIYLFSYRAPKSGNPVVRLARHNLTGMTAGLFAYVQPS